MRGPLYNGQDYLGDDPDPNIRAYLIKDMTPLPAAPIERAGLILLRRCAQLPGACEGAADTMLNQLLMRGPRQPRQFRHPAVMTGLIVVVTRHVAGRTDDLHVFMRVTA